MSEKLAVRMYEQMATLQVMDHIFYEAQRQGRISFYLTSVGEEAINIASAAALSPDDVVLPQVSRCAFKALITFGSVLFLTGNFNVWYSTESLEFFYGVASRWRSLLISVLGIKLIMAKADKCRFITVPIVSITSLSPLQSRKNL